MAPLTVFLAKLIGGFSLVMAVWMAARKDAAQAFIGAIANNPMAITIVGMIRVTFGLAIVLGHDVWDSPFAIFVSLLGWTIFFSGLFSLFAPYELVRSTFLKTQFGDRYFIFAFISFLIGGGLVIGGFSV